MHSPFSPNMAKNSSPSLRFSSDSHQVRPCKEVSPEEIDENQQHIGKDVALKPLFQKKATKHFMSPTISAASKVASTSKKILAERNESLGTTYERLVEESPAPGHLGVLSNRTPSSSKISQPDSQSLPDPDMSSLSYDPLTNYLSPRPRFLRYNPNRRLDFLRREKLKEELGLSHALSPESKKLTGEEPEVSLTDSVVSLEKEYEQQEVSHQLAENIDSEFCRGQEIQKSDGDLAEEEDEEEEEEEEERSWRGSSLLPRIFVLGFLFFGLCFLSSIYPYPSSLLPILPDLGSFDEGFLEIQDPLPYLRKSDLNNFSKQFLSLSKTLYTLVGGSICRTSKFVSFTDEQFLIAHPPVLQNDETLSGKGGSISSSDEVEWFDLEEQQYDDTVFAKIPVTAGELPVGTDGNPLFENVAGESSELDALRNAHLVQQDQESMEGNDDGEISEENIVEHEIPEIQSTEISGLSESQVIPFESVSEPDQLLQFLSNATPEMEPSSITIKATQSAYDAIDVHHSESDTGTTLETELNEQYRENSWARYVKDIFTSNAALGMSLSLVLATSITFALIRLKTKRASEPASPPFTTTIQLQASESTYLEKKPTLVCAEKEDVERQNNSHVNLSSAAQPLPADNFRPLYATHPPTVELLGLVEQVGSSEKGPSLKLKTASKQEKLRASISFSSNKVKPFVPEFSTAESLSYGSFIVQGKLTKKQEGEVVTAVMTPVRRSSRVRNRVKSP